MLWSGLIFTAQWKWGVGGAKRGVDILVHEVLPLDTVRNCPYMLVLPLQLSPTIVRLQADGRSRTLRNLFANEIENAKVLRFYFRVIAINTGKRKRAEEDNKPGSICRHNKILCFLKMKLCTVVLGILAVISSFCRELYKKNFGQSDSIWYKSRW